MERERCGRSSRTVEAGQEEAAGHRVELKRERNGERKHIAALTRRRRRKGGGQGAEVQCSPQGLEWKGGEERRKSSNRQESAKPPSVICVRLLTDETPTKSPSSSFP